MEFNRTPRLVRMNPLDLRENEYQPRQFLQENRNNLDSIAKEGVLDPITAGVIYSEAAERQEDVGVWIIDGHNRIAKAKQFGITEVPVLLLEGLARNGEEWVPFKSTEQMADLCIIYNQHDAIEALDLGRSYHKKFRKQRAEIENRIAECRSKGEKPDVETLTIARFASNEGIEVWQMNKYIRLDQLPTELKKFIKEGKLSATCALYIMSLDPSMRDLATGLVVDLEEGKVATIEIIKETFQKQLFVGENNTRHARKAIENALQEYKRITQSLKAVLSAQPDMAKTLKGMAKEGNVFLPPNIQKLIDRKPRSEISV